MVMTKSKAGRWPGGGGSHGTVPDESRLAKPCLCLDRVASSLLPDPRIGNYPRRVEPNSRRSIARCDMDVPGSLRRECALFLGTSGACEPMYIREIRPVNRCSPRGAL